MGSRSAPVIRRVLPSEHVQRFGTVLTSQALASGGNLLAVLAAARAGTAGEFGSVALLLAFYAVAASLVRPFCAHVLQITVLDARSERQRQQALGTLPLAFGLAAVLAIGFAPIGSRFFVAGTQGLLLIAVLLVPLLVVHDTLRVWAISVNRPNLAVALDGAWLVALVVGLAALRATHHWTPAAIGVVWATGGAAVAAVSWAATVVRGRRVGTIRSAAAEARRFGPLFAADSAMGAVVISGYPLVLTSVTSVEQIGRIRALEIPFGVLATIGQGFGLFLQPATRRLVRERRTDRAWQATVWGGSAMAAGALALGLACVVIPDDFLTDVFGPSFEVASPLLTAVVLKYAALGAVFVMATMVRSLGAERATLPHRLVLVLVALAVSLPLAGVDLAVGYGAMYAVLAVGCMVVIGRIRSHDFSPETV